MAADGVQCVALSILADAGAVLPGLPVNHITHQGHDRGGLICAAGTGPQCRRQFEFRSCAAGISALAGHKAQRYAFFLAGLERRAFLDVYRNAYGCPCVPVEPDCSLL